MSRAAARCPLRAARSAVSVLPLVALLAACVNATGPESRSRTAPRVVVVTSRGEHAVTVELARTDAERARGLMHRESLADDAGMLFVFPETALHGFWMKNTLIPLDMIFIDEDGVVVGIEDRAVPHSTELRHGDAQSRYVLEVNGGWCERRGVRIGDRVRFENVQLF